MAAQVMISQLPQLTVDHRWNARRVTQVLDAALRHENQFFTLNQTHLRLEEIARDVRDVARHRVCRPYTDQSTLHWALGSVLSTRVAAAGERAMYSHVLPHAPVYRRNTYILTYKGCASGPSTTQMTALGPGQGPNDTLQASALVAKLETLLCNPICVDWADVLATAAALEAILLRDPGARDLCTYIDTNIRYRCHVALGRPDKAAGVLEEALARRSVLPRADTLGQAVAVDPALRTEVQQQLGIRQLQHRCYQKCIVEATAAAALQQQQQQGAASQPSTLQISLESVQSYRSAAISNCQHMLQLATLLQNQQQQAAAAADLADLHAAAGDTAAARDHYMHCLKICCTAATKPPATAAAAAAAAAAAGLGGSSGSLWVQELLPHVVPAAVETHIALGDASGARACLLSYSNIQLARGRSACLECAVCYDVMTGETPVTLLACGHLFHRSCCNEWFGTKLFDCGSFQAECPMCRQVDEGVRPSDAALEILQELQQHHGQQNGSSSSTATSSQESDTSSSSSTHSGVGSDSQDSDAESAGETRSESVTRMVADLVGEGPGDIDGSAPTRG